jgi:hypothetical protein
MLGGADKSNGEFRSYNIGADTISKTVCKVPNQPIL